MARIAACMKTNKSKKYIHDKFLEKASNYFSELFKTDIQNIDIEILTDIQMIRSGSKDDMMNIDVHHNSDDIDQSSKVKHAGEIAKFIKKELNIPIERTLVLFFDTRKCTREPNGNLKMTPTMARVAACLKTNIPKPFINEKFLENASNNFSELFKTDIENIDIEILPDIQMIRSGSKDSMMNIDLHHNSDDIDQNSKVKHAEEIAKFIQKQLKIPKERTLVLFFDTRKCTREPNGNLKMLTEDSD